MFKKELTVFRKVLKFIWYIYILLCLFVGNLVVSDGILGGFNLTIGKRVFEWQGLFYLLFY